MFAVWQISQSQFVCGSSLTLLVVLCVAVCPSGMCSSRGICGGNNRSNRPARSEGSGSGAHYALCALGVGLIALGVVMIVWTVIPTDEESIPTPSGNNSTTETGEGDGEEEDTDSTKSSSVAMVLVGVGVIMLLLSIFLGVKSKRRAGNNGNQAGVAGAAFMDHVAGQQEE